MSPSKPMFAACAALAVGALISCSGDLSPVQRDTALPFGDGGPGPNRDAFFADDPPPKFCGPAGSQQPAPPGGTLDCPDDKNREGCPCATEGATAACWPGKRANRSRGICKDGTATCVRYDEMHLSWGPCEGYVLPKPDATMGPEACGCFSAGKWHIANLAPCVLTYPNGDVWAVSTFVEGGAAKCPTVSADKPPEKPAQDWSTSQLTVDCAGQFKLCYTIKAGRKETASPTDCVVASTCTEAWYEKDGVPQELAPLPSWVATDTSCARRFKEEGGYGEMSVLGLSVQCQAVDDGKGGPLIFNRLPYCPMVCSTSPSLSFCKDCGYDGDGSF